MDAIIEKKSFDAIIDSLSPIRDFLSEKGNSFGFDKKKIYKLCLAVDEVATNIIRHGYEENGKTGGLVDVITSFYDNKLTVILEDDAIAYNPLEHALPSEEDLKKPLEDRPIGGLGVMIAKQSVDEFKYEYNGRNRNIFVINF
ncbi:MAG: hypothetical protein A2275_10775 [Bacteroidetes bacterium RIFOXYA12_FULL_35_11]|nr:MAG: hypothetical protein A2X01_09035 [Bacteroidetes bacterium GWF2_35_48]OFY82294.1 MAG: hypothetical protein A2275_10775 [Bacteroidetes bacterium RIFOXYA12_FULL_35_11]HBX53656.1 anti-sigma regulatory factor [Bacteroidales bacterium]